MEAPQPQLRGLSSQDHQSRRRRVRHCCQGNALPEESNSTYDFVTHWSTQRQPHVHTCVKSKARTLNFLDIHLSVSISSHFFSPFRFPFCLRVHFLLQQHSYCMKSSFLFPFCLSTLFFLKCQKFRICCMCFVLLFFLLFFFYYPLLHKLFSSTDVRSNHYPSIHYSSAENNSTLGRGKSEGNKGLQMCFLGGRVVQWLALSNCS